MFVARLSSTVNEAIHLETIDSAVSLDISLDLATQRNFTFFSAFVLDGRKAPRVTSQPNADFEIEQYVR